MNKLITQISLWIEILTCTKKVKFWKYFIHGEFKEREPKVVNVIQKNRNKSYWRSVCTFRLTNNVQRFTAKGKQQYKFRLSWLLLQKFQPFDKSYAEYRTSVQLVSFFYEFWNTNGLMGLLLHANPHSLTSFME